MQLVEYFPQYNQDAVEVYFQHGVTSIDQLQAATRGEADVISAEVILNAEDKLCTADDVLLSSWLETLLLDSDGNRKSIFLTIDPLAVEQTATILQNFKADIHQPVLLEISASEMLHMQKSFPNFTWVNSLPRNPTLSDLDAVYGEVKDTEQYVMFALDLQSITSCWDRLLWLLEQSNRFSLYVEEGEASLSSQDLMYVRDNFPISHVYYSNYTTMSETIKLQEANPDRSRNFYPGGDTLDFFRMTDAIDVTWAHRANSQSELEQALADPEIKMIEADIKMFNETRPGREEGYVPVMSHDPPVSNYNLTLQEWLDYVIESGRAGSKGVKLDFKDTEAVRYGLEMVKERSKLLTFPVWVNADVLMGPNAFDYMRPVDPDLFFQYVTDIFPHVTISPGWKTMYNSLNEAKNVYTMEMMEDMHEYCRNMRQAITFPARASLTYQSIDKFQWLLAQNNRYTITVWHSTSEPITTEQLLAIYRGFPRDRVYFDIPAELMAGLKEAIENEP